MSNLLLLSLQPFPSPSLLCVNPDINIFGRERGERERERERERRIKLLIVTMRKMVYMDFRLKYGLINDWINSCAP
jgi:hypothetical protein